MNTILAEALWDKHYFYPHVRDEETEAHCALPKVNSRVFTPVLLIQLFFLFGWSPPKPDILNKKQWIPQFLDRMP